MNRSAIATRSHEDLYRGKAGKPEIVDVPTAMFLMLDGQGDPNTSPGYAQAIQALYSAAYTVKFALKKAGLSDERVPPLEGLWWGAEQENFTAATKDSWCWTMMIRLPEAASPELVDEALRDVATRRPELPISALRVESFAEGRAAQVLHLGPYAEEHPTIMALHAFVAEQGLHLRGRHHEIYLGDPRRAAPAKLKTLLRQPVI